MAWAPQQAPQQWGSSHASRAPPPSTAPAPNTDSLLNRFGLKSGDVVLGRFLIGDADEVMWYKGALNYNTIRDPRFEHCVYKILFEDGETLFYTVDYMQEQLEKGNIKRS